MCCFPNMQGGRRNFPNSQIKKKILPREQGKNGVEEILCHPKSGDLNQAELTRNETDR